MKQGLDGNSCSTSLRSPEPQSVSALTGNDQGRKCECDCEGVLDPAWAGWYDTERELPYVSHAPGECRCTNDLARYSSSDGTVRWLCSCCNTFADTRLVPQATEATNGNEA